MGSIKRSPEIEKSARAIFVDMSKAEWAEAYRDLYMQVFGAEAALAQDDSNAVAWALDAQRRAEILATYRKAEKAQASTTPTQLTCCACGNVSGGTAYWWDARLWEDGPSGPVCPVCIEAEARRKQRANAAAVADGFRPPYPSEY